MNDYEILKDKAKKMNIDLDKVIYEEDHGIGTYDNKDIEVSIVSLNGPPTKTKRKFKIFSMFQSKK